MTLYLKALGLAFFAVFALSAIEASAAQAEGAPTLTPASYPAWLTAETEGNQEIITNAGQKIECPGIRHRATIEKAGTNDTVTTVTDVKYTVGCTALVGTSTLPATVDMTGCDYRYSGGKTDVANHYISGNVAEECPAEVTGPNIIIFSNAANHTAGTALCQITVWNTITAGSITYTNLAGSPNTVTRRWSGITMPVTRSGSILCGNLTSATFNVGTIIRAYVDNGLEADGTTPKEGAQIGLTVSHL